MSNASPFWTSTLWDLSIDIKSATSHGVLTPENALWSFGSPFGTPTLTNSQHGSSLGSVKVHSLTLFAFPGACDMTPGSTYRPATLQPPCLGRKPRLGLRHFLLARNLSTPLALVASPKLGLRQSTFDIESSEGILVYINVATLALGSRPRLRGLQGCGPKGRKLGSQDKGIARVRAKRKPKSHITYSRECEKVLESVREWTLTLPLWEMESQWISKTSESHCRGQTSMDWGVLYIIRNLLKQRCLKWARIAHLDI